MTMLRPGWGMDVFAGVCFLLTYVLSPSQEHALSSRLRLGAGEEYISIALALAAGFTFRFFHTRWSPEWRRRVGLGLLVLTGFSCAGGDFIASTALAWSASLRSLLQELFRNNREDEPADTTALIMFYGFWIVTLSSILVQIGGLSALGTSFALAWTLFILGSLVQTDEENKKQEPSRHLGFVLFLGVLFFIALWWTVGGIIEAAQFCGRETVCQTMPNILESTRCELRCFLKEFFKDFLLNVIALIVVVVSSSALVSSLWHRRTITGTQNSSP